MRTALYVTSGFERGYFENALNAMSKSLQIDSPVDIYEDRDRWLAAENCLLIGAGVDGGKIKWPSAADVNKDPSLKSAIWNSFQQDIIAAMNQAVSSMTHFTRDDVVKIMKLMGNATSAFTFVNSADEEILVSDKPSGPGRISFADLASQLAAVWLHNATGVKMVSRDG